VLPPYHSLLRLTPRNLTPLPPLRYAIAIFTFCARSLTAPLLFIQYSSTEKVKALKPYQDEIKERYPNNEKMQSVLTSRLFEDTEVNPLAGCLPTLSQIPIFIALYRSILSLVQQNLLDEKFLWLPSLAGPQYGTGRGVGWLTDGWVNDIPALGWHDTIAFCVIPLVLVLSQATTQAIMTPAPDPDEKLDAGTQRTQRILKYLPLVIGASCAIAGGGGGGTGAASLEPVARPARPASTPRASQPRPRPHPQAGSPPTSRPASECTGSPPTPSQRASRWRSSSTTR